jgi:sterol desaturase/sphingolipid hydroxylase (fatty acid hydroxylase superfamily)
MENLFVFILGLLSWPILEYLLHRFLGHVLKINTLFKKEHTRHHIETNYFAPMTYKIAAALPISVSALIMARFLSDSWSLGFFFTTGFILMYGIYEWTHWSFHARAPKTSLGMKLRKHHFAHHFHHPKMNHGVTSTLIDRLAGTYRPIEVIKVPRNVALPWLFDSGGQSIDHNFSKDFELR